MVLNNRRGGLRYLDYHKIRKIAFLVFRCEQLLEPFCWLQLNRVSDDGFYSKYRKYRLSNLDCLNQIDLYRL